MAYGDYIWEINAYYDENLRGLADDFVTNDWEEVKDKVHEFVSDGNVVEIWNRETGVKQVWESDGYFADFNGESPLFYDDFYAGVKEPKKENKTMKLDLNEGYERNSGKWENLGDVNFLDGGFVLKDLGNGEYDFVACNVVWDVDSDHHYLLEEGTIDINDSWIDVDEIERFADCKKDEDPMWFARACVDYYGAENFGAYVPRRGLEDYDDVLYTAEGVEDYMKDYDLPSEIYFDGD